MQCSDVMKSSRQHVTLYADAATHGPMATERFDENQMPRPSQSPDFTQLDELWLTCWTALSTTTTTTRTPRVSLGKTVFIILGESTDLESV